MLLATARHLVQAAFVVAAADHAESFLGTGTARQVLKWVAVVALACFLGAASRGTTASYRVGAFAAADSDAAVGGAQATRQLVVASIVVAAAFFAETVLSTSTEAKIVTKAVFLTATLAN